MLPFSRQQFFEVFAAYNADTWPAPIGAYLLAMTGLFFAWHATARSGRTVGLILALMWGWVGVVYQGVYFSQINVAALVFASAFIIQALFFAAHAIIGGGLEFRTRSRVRLIAGTLMILYAMVLYPLIGLALGERYPAMPLFGVTPCPLLIFTFGLMLWARRARWWLWIVPVLWSAVGGSAFILLSVPQDWALPVSAVFAISIAWLDRRWHPASSDTPRQVGMRDPLR